jgi:Na+/H+ antiporter NhaD/arsenite permease-like protein
MLNQNSDIIQKYIIDASKGTNETSIYFWLCAITSSFLDNAPSYLLFFNMAGGNAQELMHIYPDILKAISISSVVMGAMTYIGNAPNMMVRSIVAKKGIKMPSFIGYLGWSCAIILPISFVMVFILSR